MVVLGGVYAVRTYELFNKYGACAGQHPHYSVLAWIWIHCVISIRQASAPFGYTCTIVGLEHFLMRQSAETFVHQLQVGSKHLFNCCVNLTAADVVYRNI